MRKRKRGRKFGRKRDERRALMRGIAQNLLLHGNIETTLPRAKEVRALAERAITLGKKGDLASRRRLAALFSEEAARKVFREIAGAYRGRAGGYTRIRRLAARRGDAAPRARIELVT